MPRTAPCSSRSRGSRSTKGRSEEHTSELQSLAYLVCRLLLEKKKKAKNRKSTRLNSSHTLISYASLSLNNTTKPISHVRLSARRTSRGAHILITTRHVSESIPD